ncbi:3,4-dihydroxy-2-butanone-4-phosphate synthase [Nonomuraea sp. NPDC050310]|uniref:3,4-dihydroxy-2-butanone-4-phosphate synthase n=1 Tax=Nonomuraea sp. NPDC050310 TaxID=3154935 RepID=UPI0033C5735A
MCMGVEPARDPRSAVLDRIDEAIADPRAGRPVIVVDDDDRENEGDLVMATGLATASTLAFFVRWTSGLLRAPMSAEVAERLLLPPMVADSQDPAGTAYPVSADARDGIEPSISAADPCAHRPPARRPRHPSRPAPAARPPVPAARTPGGPAERRDHTEATADLLRLAGLAPVGVISEVCNDDGSVARLRRRSRLDRPPPGPPRCPRLLQDPLRRPGPLTSSASSHKAHVESGPIAHSCPDFPRRSPA